MQSDKKGEAIFDPKVIDQLAAAQKFQFMLYESWLKLMLDGVKMYENFVEHQSKIMEHNMSALRKCDLPPCGADWFDHYGKRSHDVNIEHV